MRVKDFLQTLGSSIHVSINANGGKVPLYTGEAVAALRDKNLRKRKVIETIAVTSDKFLLLVRE
ncbi:hypothetical protein FACS1894211_12760 [Clostridia bacterium]|nr:hypothetical protein FACS1894211_12760 [Clostridia bacterium]